jgi:Flp pilus assembly protein protease CpaA
MIGIERYYFLFGLAIIWIAFAAVYDLRKREVPNWLNFSLIGFALAYRAFYASAFSDFGFFAYGLMGFALFFVIANLFYYSKIFAGGDAKLLMGIGAVLPIENLVDLVYVGGGFMMLMFLIGAAYSLVYSTIIAIRNRDKFGSEFRKNLGNRKYWLVVPAIFILLVAVLYILIGIPLEMLAVVILFSIASYFLFVYLRAVDVCMIKLVAPGKLTEGDWLHENVKLKNGWVRKSVHGLSVEDILRLRKVGKKVLIKEGVPFVPAILLAFIVMVFFLAVLGFDFWTLAYFLS